MYEQYITHECYIGIINLILSYILKVLYKNKLIKFVKSFCASKILEFSTKNINIHFTKRSWIIQHKKESKIICILMKIFRKYWYNAFKNHVSLTITNP